MLSLPRRSLWVSCIGLAKTVFDDMIHVTEVLGNISSKEWAALTDNLNVRRIDVDQWTAQKSRFVAYDDFGEEYIIRLHRHTQLHDGDIVAYDAQAKLISIISLRLQDVMVVDMGGLSRQPLDVALRTAVELGHALGNQHWAAVVRGTKVYVPLILDRKVMDSVMQSHNFDYITYSFRPADKIIPYLSPQEVRRLLGGSHHDDAHGCDF